MWGSFFFLSTLISFNCRDVVEATSQSYDRAAAQYQAAHDHVSPNVSKLRETFISLVSLNGAVLDLGSGPGRDAKYFKSQGLNVTAMDASFEMVRLASRELGYPAIHGQAQHLHSVEIYDGIWAMASLIHIPNDQLPDVFHRIFEALTPGGVFMGSFIKGIGTPDKGESLPDGRFFNRVSEARLREIVAQIPGFEILEEHTYVNDDDFHGANKPSPDFGFFNLTLRKKVE